jgi:hypothetical protein
MSVKKKEDAQNATKPKNNTRSAKKDNREVENTTERGNIRVEDPLAAFKLEDYCTPPKGGYNCLCLFSFFAFSCFYFVLGTRVHIRYGDRKQPDGVQPTEGDWIIILVEGLAHRPIITGTRCEYVPNYDTLLEGPYVHIIVDALTHKTVAVRVGGVMSIAVGADALAKVMEFARAANEKLEPEDRMKASMPLDVRKCRERFEAKERRRQEGQKKEREAGSKEEFHDSELYYVAKNGQGMCPADAITKSGKPAYLEQKNYRNQGIRQWLGGYKLSQNIGEGESVKLGRVGLCCFCVDDKTLMYSFRNSITKWFG